MHGDSEEKKPMRSQEEVERAYELLIKYAVPAAVAEDDPVTAATVAAAADVFCWLLGHKHPIQFADMLSYIEQRLAARKEKTENAEKHWRN
jgi:hypothetical protein